VGTSRRDVRWGPNADASARHPYQQLANANLLVVLCCSQRRFQPVEALGLAGGVGVRDVNGAIGARNVGPHGRPEVVGQIAGALQLILISRRGGEIEEAIVPAEPNGAEAWDTVFVSAEVGLAVAGAGPVLQ